MVFRSVACYLLGVVMLFSVLSATPASSQVTVPYQWIVPGAYAKFAAVTPLALFYPNITRVIFWTGGPVLEWTVMDRVGDSARLNVTFVAEGMAMVYYEESVPDGIVNILDIALVAKAFGKGVYEWGFTPDADVTGPNGEPDQKVNILDISRTLILDVDVYSRESFLDGKPLGKTCFWAEPYADVGDDIVLYDLPEEIVGNVTGIDEDWAGWSGVTSYRVGVLQYDPFVRMDPHFDWHTGMAMQIYLLGNLQINPDGDFSFNEIPIKRFAYTPLGTELNIGTADAFELNLASTNVQLGPPT